MIDVGITMKELEELELETLHTIQNNFAFFFNKESTSKLATKVLAGGGGRTKEKIVRASWNKNVLGSRARMLTPSP